jgi:hypothetical protein
MMRVLKAVSAAVLIGALASGCGTKTAENAALETSSLQASSARLKIYRTSDIIASGPAAVVRIDGREVASLGIGGSTVVDIPAGERKVVVDAFGALGAYTLPLHAKAGTLYTMEISPRSEAVVAGALFGLVGSAIEAATANENGGANFQIRIVDEKPVKS